MPLEFTKRDLYGGAIVVSLPTDLIDASDLRQIPDHQEVFLRRNALTSIIFEINEYQTDDHITIATTNTEPTNSASATTPTQPPDEQAATHHLTDLIQPPDYLAKSSLQTASTALSRPSLANFPVYHTTATIITPEVDVRAARQSTLPVAWQSNPVQKEYETRTLQLLVRMKEYETDFCVRIDVPLKEFDENREGGEMETRWAEEVFQQIIQTIDIKEFGLFGST